VLENRQESSHSADDFEHQHLIAGYVKIIHEQKVYLKKQIPRNPEFKNLPESSMIPDLMNHEIWS
jgi:hypothetical protein